MFFTLELVNLFTIFNAVLVAVWNEQQRGQTDFSKFWFFQLSSANWQ